MMSQTKPSEPHASTHDPSAVVEGPRRQSTALHHTVSSPEPAPPQGTQAQILRRDGQRHLAMRQPNRLALQDLLDDALVYCHSSGRLDDKAAHIAAVMEGRVVYHSISREVAGLSVRADSALMHGRCQMGITVGGTPRTLDYPFQSIWVWRSGVWRMLTWAPTVLPVETSPASQSP